MAPARSTASPVLAALNLGIVYVVWGSTYLAIRLVVETLPPFLAAGARFVIAGAVMVGLLWLRARLTRSRLEPGRIGWREWRSAAIIGGLLLFGANGFVSQAERLVDSGIAAVLIAAVPIWMSLFDSVATRRRPSALAIGGVVAGFAGIVVLLAPMGGVSAINPVGVGMLVFSAISWALGSIYARHAPMPHNGLLGAGMEMLAGGVILFVAGAVIGEPMQVNPAGVSLTSVLALAYLVVFGSLVAFSSYTWLLQNAPVTTVATYAYVNPLVAVALGAFLLHEQITVRTIVASVLIVGAVVAMVSGRARTAVEETPVGELEDEPPAAGRERPRHDGVDRAAAD